MAAAFDTLTADQCREARRLLGWSQPRLAEEARLFQETISLFERGKRAPLASTLATLARTFEAAGVEFIPGSARLRERASAEQAILPGAQMKVS